MLSLPGLWRDESWSALSHDMPPAKLGVKLVTWCAGGIAAPQLGVQFISMQLGRGIDQQVSVLKNCEYVECTPPLCFLCYIDLGNQGPTINNQVGSWGWDSQGPSRQSTSLNLPQSGPLPAKEDWGGVLYTVQLYHIPKPVISHNHSGSIMDHQMKFAATQQYGRSSIIAH